MSLQNTSTHPPTLHPHFLPTDGQNRKEGREGGQREGKKEFALNWVPFQVRAGQHPALCSSAPGPAQATPPTAKAAADGPDEPQEEAASTDGAVYPQPVAGNSSGMKFSCAQGSKPDCLSLPKSGQSCTAAPPSGQGLYQSAD